MRGTDGVEYERGKDKGEMADFLDFKSQKNPKIEKHFSLYE